MKKIAILGSTGSIGTQTLDVVCANGRILKFWYQRRDGILRSWKESRSGEFSPQLVAVWDENAARDLGTEDPGYDTKRSVRYGWTS